jgi:hypothetical protein
MSGWVDGHPPSRVPTKPSAARTREREPEPLRQPRARASRVGFSEQNVKLLVNGYRTEARIIAHIAEVEERKLHAKDGSPSLFEYCVKQLGLSESEAFHRLTAARIARRFPIVFSLIERRRIHLTAVCLLRDYLTPENHLELLAEASNKTKLQVQELLVRRFPRPDVASYVRKLPRATETATSAASLIAGEASTISADAAGEHSAHAEPPMLVGIATARAGPRDSRTHLGGSLPHPTQCKLIPERKTRAFPSPGQSFHSKR